MILADGSKVGAKDIHGFRYWDMPAGNYQAVATFKMPYFRIGIYIAIFGLAVLLIVAGYFFRFRKQT
jgi:LPXTG-motif cell wall-anchored protein